MAQPIILSSTHIGILHKLGRMYGSGLAFSNIHISPTGGAMCDWKTNTQTWDKIDSAYKIGCIDVEASREDLVSFLDWFDRQEKDNIELRSQFGTNRPRTEAEKSLFTYLRLAQAFNYPQDIKKNDE